ncbi:glycosyltransferase [Pediococcus ethanolidurans]|uniref:glycosyltransferase n=1 Tax=Pediococcus ethanolidurans TaxID=319653 RepID=UPI001C1E9E1E|nr:glycosyltransferase [Pediococcus ethanolidurans]MBU7554423.1 glycosyltransferase [Pediococcus ethanolidurans]MBU7562692.1 glycosyltransferase [Pediococcus ethanolidurans]MCT4397544.1 glycosyltransferase family 4 protein [Pediococcus ethanolidurans]MCV3314424.1 glycosyltransferase [Pediococcus ethanolidurans]MCV3320611.1 glycosyltransferase [Pediococcus ethanolidurans]
MKILIVLENVVMDGVKRAATVMGNALTEHADVTYYSLEDVTPYYELQAKLVVAKRPDPGHVLNYFGEKPYEKYSEQIEDLCDFIQNENFQSVVLAAGLTTSFAPLIKKRVPNLQIIVWMHNNYKTYMTQYYQRMREEFVSGLKIADTVVVLTNSDLKNYRQFNANTVKIYNPLTLLPEKQSDLKSHLIAFTARIAIPHKGIDLLLEAAQFLPTDWKIAIAGQGVPEQMTLFRQLIEKFNVTDKIIYRGALKDSALQAHYETASIFVSTSRWEGMPLVIGEAMAFGLPIVAMENTGSAEFLGHNQYGLLTKAQDVPDFVRGLNKLMVSEPLRHAYAQKSLERIQSFKIETVIRQWLAVLTQSDSNSAATK